MAIFGRGCVALSMIQVAIFLTFEDLQTYLFDITATSKPDSNVRNITNLVQTKSDHSSKPSSEESIDLIETKHVAAKERMELNHGQNTANLIQTNPDHSNEPSSAENIELIESNDVEEKETTKLIQTDTDVFDPSLTLEDYAFLEPSKPSDKWLHSCAETLKNDTSIVKPFSTTDEWGWYRLGDCIRRCSFCTQGFSKRERNRWMKKGANVTKLSKLAQIYYYMGGKNGEPSCQVYNYDKVEAALNQVKNMKNYSKPDPEAIVVHLRLGDVVEYQGSPPGDLLTKGGYGKHPAVGKNYRSIRTVADYLDIFEAINNKANQKIVIVGGSHKPTLYKKSRVYANCLQRGLAKAGKQVEMYLDNESPDYDFFFMSHANYFVASTGGFSRVMGEMVEKHGGLHVKFESDKKGNSTVSNLTLSVQNAINSMQTNPDHPKQDFSNEISPHAPATTHSALENTDSTEVRDAAAEDATELMQTNPDHPKQDSSKDITAHPPATTQSEKTYLTEVRDATMEDATGLIQTDTDVFDPSLTLEDYAFLEPSRPSDKWLHSCAETLKNDTSIVKPFSTNDEWGWYRLGDCIKLCKFCTQGQSRGQMNKWKYKQGGNITKLKKLAQIFYYMGGEKGEPSCEAYNLNKVQAAFDQVKNREGFSKPDPEAIVIHLRLGDVVEYQGSPPGDLLTKGGYGKHPGVGTKYKSIRTVADYLDIFEAMNSTANQKIVIVGGSHKANLYKKSRVYANCLQRGLAKAGKQVEMHVDSENPDHDFYYMSHAKRFIASTGGFSRIMGQMAERHGGLHWNKFGDQTNMKEKYADVHLP